MRKGQMMLAAVLTCILIAGVVAPGIAVAAVTYVAVDEILVSLTINSSGKATCLSSLQAISTANTPILTLTLKRSADGRVWSTLHTWTKTGTGILGVAIGEYPIVSSGYQYKLVATGKIMSPQGVVLETVSISSSVVAY